MQAMNNPPSSSLKQLAHIAMPLSVSESNGKLQTTISGGAQSLIKATRLDDSNIINGVRKENVRRQKVDGSSADTHEATMLKMLKKKDGPSRQTLATESEKRPETKPQAEAEVDLNDKQDQHNQSEREKVNKTLSSVAPKPSHIQVMNTLVKRMDAKGIQRLLHALQNDRFRVSDLVNKASVSGSTPLFSAAWDGRVDILKVLVAYGAKVNWTNLRGNTPMHMAVEQNHFAFCQELLKCGADVVDVEQIRARTKKPISDKIDQLMHEIARMPVLDDGGNQKEAKEQDGGDGTHAEIQADKKTDRETSKRENHVLRNQNNHVNRLRAQEKADRLVQTVLWHGCRWGLVSRISLVFNNNSVDGVLSSMVKAFLCQRRVPDGRTMVSLAAGEGHVDICKLLYKHGADPSLADHAGRSALHYAIARDSLTTVKFLVETCKVSVAGIDLEDIREWSTRNICGRVELFIQGLRQKGQKKTVRTRRRSSLPLPVSSSLEASFLSSQQLLASLKGKEGKTTDDSQWSVSDKTGGSSLSSSVLDFVPAVDRTDAQRGLLGNKKVRAPLLPKQTQRASSFPASADSKVSPNAGDGDSEEAGEEAGNAGTSSTTMGATNTDGGKTVNPEQSDDEESETRARTQNQSIDVRDTETENDSDLHTTDMEEGSEETELYPSPGANLSSHDIAVKGIVQRSVPDALLHTAERSRPKRKGMSIDNLVKSGDAGALKHHLASLAAAASADANSNDVAGHQSKGSASATKVRALVNKASVSGSTPLFSAAWDGRVDILKVLVAYGAKVNWTNLRGNTPMHMAVEQNHFAFCQELLKCGADVVDVHEIRRRTQKTISIQIDQLLKQKKILPDMRDCGSKVEIILVMLWHACKWGLVKRAEKCFHDEHLQKKMLNTPRESDGRTMVSLAAGEGHVDICKLLYKHGADPSLADHAGRSALHYAIARDSLTTVKFLVETCKVSVAGIDLEDIREWSTRSIGKRMELFIVARPEYQRHLAHLREAESATANSTIESSRALVPVEHVIVADVDKEMKRNQTEDEKRAMLIRPRNGLIQSYIKANDMESLQQYFVSMKMLKVGRRKVMSLVNEASASGSTPLFSAAWDGRVDILKVLVAYGAKVNWTNLRGNTPMHMAVEQNHFAFCQELLKCGADVVDVEQIRARTKKPISDKIDQLMSNAQAPAKVSSTENKMAIRFNLLEHACRWNKRKIAKKVLKNKNHRLLLLDCFTVGGRNLLSLAAGKGHVDICRLLIKCKVNVDYRNHKERSALHYALAGNHRSVVKFLLEEAGANTYGVDLSHIRSWSSRQLANRFDSIMDNNPPLSIMYTERVFALWKLPMLPQKQKQRRASVFDMRTANKQREFTQLQPGQDLKEGFECQYLHPDYSDSRGETDQMNMSIIPGDRNRKPAIGSVEDYNHRPAHRIDVGSGLFALNRKQRAASCNTHTRSARKIARSCSHDVLPGVVAGAAYNHIGNLHYDSTYKRMKIKARKDMNIRRDRTKGKDEDEEDSGQHLQSSSYTSCLLGLDAVNKRKTYLVQAIVPRIVREKYTERWRLRRMGGKIRRAGRRSLASSSSSMSTNHLALIEHQSAGSEARDGTGPTFYFRGKQLMSAP